MSADLLAPGSVLQDTYRIIRRVGEGGMGEVYEAAHARLPGRFAVKLLLREVAANPEAFARFRREAEITSALRHPNIVQVVDFNQFPDGSPYMVMEFLDGQDLASHLQGGRSLPLAEAVAIVEQVASGLAAAHSQGVVHRDLKPQNIYLVPVVGQDKVFAKIVDFGISKVKTATKNLTRESAVLGTPQYMSPEQALGRGAEVDSKTDQFALAAIAYEMLAGQEAFAGENLPTILYQVVHENPPPIGLKDTASAPVEAVIRRGLSKRREDRFPSVLEFAKAFSEAATPPPSSSRSAMAAAVVLAPRDAKKPATPKPTTFSHTASEILIPDDRRARRRMIGLAAAGGVGLALLIGVVLRPSRPSTRTLPVAASPLAPEPPRPSLAPRKEPPRAEVVSLPAPSPPAALPPQAPKKVREMRKPAPTRTAAPAPSDTPPPAAKPASAAPPAPPPESTKRKKGSVFDDL